MAKKSLATSKTKMILFLLIIPFFTLSILFAFWARNVVWWEVAILLSVSFSTTAVCEFATETIACYDTEYWTNKVAEAQYYESWTEVNTNTDKDGKQTTNYTYHPASYQLITSGNGGSLYVSKIEYEKVKARFKNEHKKDIFRLNQSSWGDGDMFYTKFTSSSLPVVATQRRHYSNKVLAARNSFSFPEVSKQERKAYNLVDYPSDKRYIYTPSILGGNCKDKAIADKSLCLYNAELGQQKQVRIWFVIYKNQPVDSAIKQENYWVGGNKNEIVVCIGIDDNEAVKWAYVFSWTENENLKVVIKNYIQEQEKIDLLKSVDFTAKEVAQHWQRKKFKDFDYLKSEPPVWTFLLSFVIVIIANVGISAYVVKNEIDK